MRPDAAALFTALAADYLAETRSGDGPVSTSLSAAELAARFDEPMPREGKPLAQVAARLHDEVIADCNHLYHPRYAGHQVSAPLPAAIWAESVTAALNQSVAVAEMSPTGTALEHRVIRWMCDLVGYGERAGGTLTSGGTEATFTALLAARSVALPDVWTNGLPADPPVVVYGEQAHYAVARAVGEMGLGMRNAIVVPTRDYRMDVDALRATLDRLQSESRTVMAVVATAGSTPTGSFDDIDAIGRLCEKRGLWFHVDAAHGGSALFSAKHAAKMKGIERASSIAWDPHKMMLMPLSAGVVLVKDERVLDGAFSQAAPYLFHGATSRGDRDWDQGKRSFLCSRRVDAIKLWVALQRYGADGFGALYDRLCDTALVMQEMLVEHPDFTPLHVPESNILCFRWTGGPPSGEDERDAANLAIRERYNRSGDGWITTTVLDGRRVLRVTMMNPRTTPGHVARLVAGLASVGSAVRGPTGVPNG